MQVALGLDFSYTIKLRIIDANNKVLLTGENQGDSAKRKAVRVVVYRNCSKEFLKAAEEAAHKDSP